MNLTPRWCHVTMGNISSKESKKEPIFFIRSVTRKHWLEWLLNHIMNVIGGYYLKMSEGIRISWDEWRYGKSVHTNMKVGRVYRGSDWWIRKRLCLDFE